MSKRLTKMALCFFMAFIVLLATKGQAYAQPIGLDGEAAERYEKNTRRLKEIYERAMDGVLDDPNKVLDGRHPGEWLYCHAYSAYCDIRNAAPFLGAMSILFGTLLGFIIRRNKLLLKKVLIGMVFGIPFMLTVFVFGIGAII